MSGDSERRHPTANADTTGSRWSQLKALFDSAISLDSGERQTFVERGCGDDQELRNELESLLAAYEGTDDFLELPLGESIKSLAEMPFPESQSDEQLIGSRIGAYRLDREIGRGGMGAVYLATRADSEFDKRVAIKLMRRGKENDFALRRFRNERQILARIENPYVARLIDGGTTQAGQPYFVMEYVEGQSVTKYCDAHLLNTRERLALFLKICSAVRYAHEKNIIHRDLKPSNILVKQDGTPKLLDFGIAKFIDAEQGVNAEATIAGFRMLTPAYASPEQLRGDAASGRSDVYSLGVILYELLCGERPSLSTFQRSGAGDLPQEAHLSAHLRAIVFRAIRWDPEDRYPSVGAFSADIERYLDGLPPQASSATMLELDSTPAQISIAILPLRTLETQDGTDGFLATGITEALIARLSRVERVSVRPTSAVLKYTGRSDTSRAAKDLRVKYVLEGSIHTLEDQVRVTVQLVFSEAGIAVWAAQFDERKRDILKLEDSLAEQVAYALVPQLTGEERLQVSRSGTSNALAHQAYLRGRWHWNRSAGDQAELTHALVCFSQAIDLDPNYARAHAGLADYYVRLGLWGGLPPSESFAAAIPSAEAAVTLDPSLGEAHASLAFALWAYRRDYAAAEEHFNLAIIRSPDYASGHHWYGLLNSARHRPELAIATLERARKVDPNSPAIAAALGFVHYNARQFEKAIQVLLEASRELRNSAPICEMLGWCYLETEDAGKALEAAHTAVELSKRSSSSLCLLAHTEIKAGNRSAALALLEELEQMARQLYVSGYDRATAFLAIGDTQNALRYLEQAFADRDWWVCWVAVEPRWDPLRSESRFTQLVLKTQPSRTGPVVAAEAPPARLGKGRRAAAVAAVCALAIVALALLWWTNRNHPAPFSTLKFTKLTSDGTADNAIISPDGRYVAYTAMEGGDTGLFVRELGSSRTRELVPHLRGYVGELGFTGNGREVSFVNFAADVPALRHLYAISVSGGAPRQVLGTFPAAVTLSLDGSRAAWVNPNAAAHRDELWVTEVASRQSRMLLSHKYPERFTNTSVPAWSSDGKSIAYALEQTDSKGFLVRLYVTDADTGRMHYIASPRWQVVERIAWLGDRSGLDVIGQEHEASFQQIWYVPFSRGESRRIGNDLNMYYGISVTADNTAMVSVEEQTLSNVYICNGADTTHPTQVTPGSGRYFDVSWTGAGHILYASDATGSADIWEMNADGTGQRQLTFGTGRSYAPAMAANGKVVVFHSNRSGGWQIWRADPDGGNPRQLSSSTRDANWPEITRDSQFVIYHQSDASGAYNLWRVPVEGGAPVRITDAPTMHPAISPIDGRIAAWYSDNREHSRWKIAIFGPGGGSALQVFDATPAAQPDTPLAWTAAGDGIGYVDQANGVSNIWVQPLNGGRPRQFTAFPSGNIYSFHWSPNGKLVYSRGLTTADVVLIRDTARSARSRNSR